VAFTAPVPRPPRGLSTQPRRPLDDALTSPWASAGPRPFLSGASDLSPSFHPKCSLAVSPARAHPELGPRSLDPDRPFGSAFAERIWDQTPPTDFCNCIRRHAGNQTIDSRSSQGRRPRPPSFSFLPRILPCGSGDRWRAAQRPIRTSPGAGSSRFHGFARPRCHCERITLMGYTPRG